MREPVAGSIRVVVGGDFCPVQRAEKTLSERRLPVEERFDGVGEVTRQGDLIILNLECPLTHSHEAVEKSGGNLRADPSAISLLTWLNVGLVTLANNHILDYDRNGLADTIELCSKHGIDTVGAGHTLEDASKVYYTQKKGRVLAVINAAEMEFATATRRRGGANPLDLISLTEDIRTARRQADHVLLVIHGGLEYVHFPSPESVRTLRFLAEQGATAIIRHHPHWVQGHEVWKGVPIFYSVGNFLFDWSPAMKGEAWSEGILVELTISEKDECAFVVHVCKQHRPGPRVEILDGAQRERFMMEYRKLSIALGNASALRDEWISTLQKRQFEYLGRLILPHPLSVRIARRLGLLRFARPLRKNRRILENVLRCSAHREALLDILERDREGWRIP
ncbi:MAG: CapA family protein [Armatimonadetes bacterium]|nr:CapA family protein [Armatimonadota bacterium]